jgi:hypothetical protein
MGFRFITARDRPETVARNTAKYEHRLKRALATAISRGGTSADTIKVLLRSATVQGRVRGQEIKAGVVSFEAPPFPGGLHQFWPWQVLNQLSDRDLASAIARELRREVRRKMGVVNRR